MGYELNQLMKQYGVNTPSMATYTGAAAPSTEFNSEYYAKANPDLKKKKIDTPEELLKHYTETGQKEGRLGYDKTVFDEQMRKYGLDQKSYETYKTDYQNRLQNTPMYLDSQYDTGNRPVSDAMKFATSETKDAATGQGMGVDKFYGNTRQYVADNPYASTQSNQDYMKKYGISNQDVYDATGSYYGNQLNNPTYGAVPLSLVNQTPQQKADYYLQQRNLGYTDADLRSATTKTFGAPVESDWTELLKRAYPQYAQNVNDAYKSIGRTKFTGNDAFPLIDNTGYNYWMNQVSSGSIKPENLPKHIQQAALADGSWKPLPEHTPDFSSLTLPAARGGSVYDLADKYAHGGQVKTHYQTAGAVNLPEGYDMDGMQLAAVDTVENPYKSDEDMRNRAAAATDARIKSYLADLPEIAAAPPANNAAPVAVAPPAMPFGNERMANIQALLATYGPKDSAYANDLKAARTAAKAESDAFANMLKTAMSSPEDEKSSKAEMYFRLAAAFGSPTKTGQFTENLGMVGKELGEYAKGKRTSAREKLALGLEAQKLKMASSKEDLNTLRALSAEEMKDKRTIATELIKDYIKSGEPQSSAGKQALDEGLKPGTEAYQKRVAEIGNLNVEAKMAQITSSLAGINTAAANLNLAQSNAQLNQLKFQNLKEQQAKLSPAELKMKVEAEDLIASSKQSLADLKQAYALNPNSLAGGWLDKGQQWLSEAAGSKDPTIVNTRILNNLLGAQGLAKLKATFGGAPTEGERAILMELEGIGSKTKEERGAIIKRTYKVLQDRAAREQARLDKINSGAYRTTSPLEGGSD